MVVAQIRNTAPRASSHSCQKAIPKPSTQMAIAIVNGQMQSGLAHYRTFGQREGRRLSC